MREIRYFGLDQWAEMREFVLKLGDEKRGSNIAIYGAPSDDSYVVEWDEEPVDLENK